MTVGTPDPASAIQAVLDEPSTRHALLDWVSLSSLLDQCIVPGRFRLDDDWVGPLRFTELGMETVRAVLAERKSLRDVDVKLGVALTIGGGDGLFVSPSTDTDAMRKVISSAIQKQNILYPYIFGRELHDQAANDFPAKTSLTNRETVALLKQLPVGVFQSGWTTVGPFGCLVSTEFRSLPPSFLVPGYHCEVANCAKVHAIRIHTADTSIVRARSRISDYVSSREGTRYPSGARLVRDAMVKEANAFGFTNSAALINTVADGLTVEELQQVCAELLRSHFRANSSNQRNFSKQINVVVHDLSTFTSTLDRASLLHIALLFSDRELVAAVDNTVLSGAISLQPFEQRVHKNARFTSSSSSVVEIGERGLRFRGDASTGYVSRKLFALLDDIYFKSGVKEVQDLVYQLGEEPDSPAQGLLDRAVTKMSPADAIERLVLADRGAAARAAEFLLLDTQGQNYNREKLHELLTWKLGLPASVEFDGLRRVEHFERLVAGNLEQPLFQSETVRGDLSNLFTALEDALFRSIGYATWALTADHFLAETGFEYDAVISAQSLTLLDVHAPVDEPHLRIVPDGRTTLAPLAAGFGRLARALRSLNQDSHTRPTSEYPQECRVSDRPFAFPNRIQYFNLSVASQKAVLQLLRDASQLAQDSNIAEVRNATLHGNNTFPAIDVIRLAVERISQWRALVTSAGIYPCVYDFTSSHRDALGHRLNAYERGPSSVSLQAPSWTVAPRLPSTSPRILIMPAAVFQSSGPLRFTVNPRPGGDPYWLGYPRRWKVSSDFAGTDSTVEGGGADAEPGLPAAG